MPASKGSEALKARLKLGKPGAAKELADDLGVYESLVSRWIHGLTTPNAGHRIDLNERFQIPLRAWDEPLPEADTDPGLDTEHKAAS